MANNFSKEIDQEMERLIKQINEELEGGILYGWNLVTGATPVETGRARASWFITVDILPVNSKPPVGGKERVYPDPPPPDFSFDLKQNRHLYIVNNVNYIEYLEYGTDRMVAFAMATNAIPKINRKLETAFKNIKSISK